MLNIPWKNDLLDDLPHNPQLNFMVQPIPPWPLCKNKGGAAKLPLIFVSVYGIVIPISSLAFQKQSQHAERALSSPLPAIPGREMKGGGSSHHFANQIFLLKK